MYAFYTLLYKTQSNIKIFMMHNKHFKTAICFKLKNEQIGVIHMLYQNIVKRKCYYF